MRRAASAHVAACSPQSGTGWRCGPKKYWNCTAPRIAACTSGWRAEADREDYRVRVTDGGKRLARSRHNLHAAGLTVGEWREAWGCARWRIEAIGSGDERFGNLTITITPDGEASIRLPRPLEHLANARRGRYILSGRARFSYRGDEWLARITGGKPVSCTITREPGRAGVYLTASWSAALKPPGTEARADGPVAGVDLNDGHLAVRRLDKHGNPAGRPERISFALTGSSTRRDAQVRHSITCLIRYCQRHHINTIAVEDLDFADARATGRETMPGNRYPGNGPQQPPTSVTVHVHLSADAAGMHAAGHEFFRAANGVWLTASVPPAFISSLPPG
jgi:hypothetical protein